MSVLSDWYGWDRIRDLEFDLEHPLIAISLGAGVQSTYMYLQACRGGFLDYGPKPHVAIFADPQAELAGTYRHLDWLEREFSAEIPILRVTSGSLEKNLYWGGEGRKGAAQIPVFLSGDDGRGIGLRQCTADFKLRPIQRACRDLLGLEPGERAAGRYRVEQWIGISTDEAHRAKPSAVSWVERRYPLLFDRPTRRGDCLLWMEREGYPIPVASSCFFCPFHSDEEWRRIRSSEPELFARAVKIDQDLRGGGIAMGKRLVKEQYLHSGLKPLGETKFLNEDQPDFFGNECEGHCGV